MAERVQVARDVLRRCVKGTSLRELDRRLGRSANYVARVLRGEIELSFEKVFEILAAAKVDAGEYFEELAGELRQTGERAAGIPRDERPSDSVRALTARRLRTLEERLALQEQRLADLEGKGGDQDGH